MCVIAAAALSVWLITSRRVFFRIDMTEEGRFTIAECTREIVSAIDEPVHIDVYLGGDIDANMVRLRHAVRDLIDEFNAYAGEKITVAYIDPNDAPDDESRYAGYERLERRGLMGMSVAVRDAHGGVSQQVVFPWAEVSAHGDTVPVCLLQPGMEASGEAAVNAAMEDHEYLFADAIRILQQRDVRKIAFIEGHGELSEAETYDISAALSRYVQVDRGVLGAEDNVLGRDLLLFSNPDTVKGRSRLTIKASLDDGMTWPPQCQLLLDEDEGWGYSCLTMIDRETVGILYESSAAQITFQAIRLTDIVRE